METTHSPQTKDETNLRPLNVRSNIRDNMLCVLFLSYFFKNERKPSKMPHTSLLMLDASNGDSSATT
jgi:hypothetical protein